MNEKTADLVTRYREGDELAAQELFARYVERLTRLARSRLSPKLSSRFDPDDVVLSAYRSFFLGARDVMISVCEPRGRALGVTEDDFEGKNSGFGTSVDAANAYVGYDRVVTF